MQWWRMGTVLALALSVHAVSAGDREAMTFEVIDAQCSGSASYCSGAILGRGLITSATPAAFRDVLKSYKGPKLLLLDSPGGNLSAGMELGETIRKNWFDVQVGPEYEKVTGLWETVVLVRSPKCSSACVYAMNLPPLSA